MARLGPGRPLRWMTALDKIRLTGLLRRGPAPRRGLSTSRSVPVWARPDAPRWEAATPPYHQYVLGHRLPPATPGHHPSWHRTPLSGHEAAVGRGETRSGQDRLAISAAPTVGHAVRLAPGLALIQRHHLSPAQWAGDRMLGGESLPNPDEMLIEGWLAAQVPEPRWRQGQGAHEMFLISPTTRPSTRTSRLRIGSMVAFSGWSRTWSASWKKRLTVASSPTRATTISPSAAVS